MMTGIQGPFLRELSVAPVQPRSPGGSPGPIDAFTPQEQLGGEISMRDMMRFKAGPPPATQADQAVYARTVQRLEGGLGLTQAEHQTLKKGFAGEPQLQALLSHDKPRPGGAAGPARSAGDVKQGLLQRLGDALREECEKMGEKCLKTSESISKAAKEFGSNPRLAKLCPTLGVLASAIGSLANGIRGISGQGDPKQMAADLAKAVKDLLKLMEKTPLKNMAKAGTKLLPGLGELTTGWDIYSATRKAAACSKKGDKGAALAWSVVASLNTLAFSLRATCDLAAVITALTVGGAAPGTGPVMAGCEAVVGVLAGASELVAMALD